MSESAEKFETWAIVEVMGFKKYAGHVSEQIIGSTSLLRVDVPQVSDDHPAFCKLIGVGSIYAITPCDEATARKVARVLSSENPLPVYIPNEQLRITSGTAERPPYDDDVDRSLPF